MPRIGGDPLLDLDQCIEATMDVADRIEHTPIVIEEEPIAAAGARRPAPGRAQVRQDRSHVATIPLLRQRTVLDDSMRR
jgi:hypothetical protein